jgi:DNA polymerase III sliding clamp (beta) subunit (PCNA family)
MKLDREQFIKAVKFLKPAIMVSEAEDSKNYVHVIIDQDKCQLTACDGAVGKRVTLIKPNQIDFVDNGRDLDDVKEYLIDKPMLEAFETLCQKHKKKLEKKMYRGAKKDVDLSLKVIEISSNILISHRDELNYKQPTCTYPDLNKYFQAYGERMTGLKANPQVVIDALKECPDSEVEFTFCGEGQAVFIETEDRLFQSFFMPVK